MTHDHHLIHDPPTSLPSSILYPVVLADVRQGTAASTAGSVKFSAWIYRCRCLVLVPSHPKRVFNLANRSHASHWPPQSPQRTNWERPRRKTVREWPRWHPNRSVFDSGDFGASSAERQASRCWVDAAGQLEWCRCPFAGLNRSVSSWTFFVVHRHKQTVQVPVGQHIHRSRQR